MYSILVFFLKVGSQAFQLTSRHETLAAQLLTDLGIGYSQTNSEVDFWFNPKAAISCADEL